MARSVCHVCAIIVETLSAAPLYLQPGKWRLAVELVFRGKKCSPALSVWSPGPPPAPATVHLAPVLSRRDLITSLLSAIMVREFIINRATRRIGQSQAGSELAYM